jgi:DNA invertase Pin-like site-specific DNA recombinase
LKQILDAGVRVFFYLEEHERTLDSALEKMMLSLTNFAAEMEREKGRQRTYDAMARKARSLKPAMRRQLLADKLDVQLPLDQPSQARYAQAHQQGLLCEGIDIGVFSLKTTQEAFLLQVDRAFTQHLFSDWC